MKTMPNNEGDGKRTGCKRLVTIRLQKPEGANTETIPLDTSCKREIVDQTWTDDTEKVILVNMDHYSVPKKWKQVAHLARLAGQSDNPTQAYAADGTPILDRELRQMLFATPVPKHEEKKDLRNIATNALYDQIVHCLQTAVAANDMGRFKKLLKLSAEVTGKLMKMEELASGKKLVKEDDAMEAKK
ncbi:hypothetical protein KEM55_004270 [Ascosphaera atra]|nr:hypothetical protein KEM55_004270 [Ascosphaera atra]